MRRTLRVGLLAASLLGLMGTLAPTPANATSAGSITFTGVATVGGHGIAYPLIGSDGQPDLSKVPTSLHNSAAVSFNSTTCVAVGTTVNKPGKLPVEAGTCSITAHGQVHGYCGLSEGTVHGTVSVAVVGDGNQHYSFSVSWVAVGGELVVTGHVHKHGTTHSGVIEGVVTATPDVLGQFGGGSCLNKHAKNFIVTGAISYEMLSTPVSLPHVTL